FRPRGSPDLPAADFVAAKQHRNALRQKQRGQEISLLTITQLGDLRVFRGSLRAALPRSIMAFHVAAFFTVGFVVLVIIRDEIIERKTVVSGDKIDAGVGLSSGHLVEVGTTGV